MLVAVVFIVNDKHQKEVGKNGIYNLIYQEEIETQTQRINIWRPGGKGGGRGMNQEIGLI